MTFDIILFDLSNNSKYAYIYDRRKNVTIQYMDNVHFELISFDSPVKSCLKSVCLLMLGPPFCWQRLG